MKKEMIKAIRLVNGFNPDLRVKLDTTINKSALYDWIDNNRFGILGIDKALIRNSDYPKYERIVWGAVRCVTMGVSDED